MSFTYQDPQYFLTQGHGPWGQQSWTYDRIGNRLSELSSSETFTYTYQSGHNPKLSRIQPAPGGEPGSRLDFSYDARGNQTTAAVTTPESSGWTSILNYSPESRLSRLSTSNGPASTELLYDGRGFLRRSRLTATNTTDFEQTEPVYTSEGLLLARRYHKQSTQGGRGDAGTLPIARVTMNTTYLFYFAGRPVAQLTRPQSGADTLLYLTADHLGTPIQATDTSGAIVWEGGLDPFGTPFVFPRQGPSEGGDRDSPITGGAASTSATMEGAGIFLRFPGQWDDPSFRASGLRGGVYYNVHRYYVRGTGRYASPDPLGLRSGTHLYDYVFNNPLGYSDPLGLRPAEACGFTWVGFLGAMGDINNQVIFCASCKCGPPKINDVTYGDQPSPPPGVEPPAGVAPVPSTPSLPFSTFDRCKCTGPEKIYVNVQTRRSLSILQFLYSARKVHLDYDCPRDGR